MIEFSLDEQTRLRQIAGLRLLDTESEGGGERDLDEDPR